MFYTQMIKNFFCKKTAFTLAEVLITLSIIGVVSAITIPTVQKKYLAFQFSSAFKKAYSEVGQMSKMLVLEYGTNDLYGELGSSTAVNSTQKGLAKSVENYLKNTTNKPQRAIAGKIYDTNGKEVKYKNYSGTANMYTPILDDGGYELMDGRAIWFEGGFEKNAFIISYDINGLSSPPNRFGYDLFSFVLGEDGQFYPIGSPRINMTKISYAYCGAEAKNVTSGCSKTSKSTCNGISCSYKAVTDKDYFSELYK